MFSLDSRNVYHATLLDDLSWLEHGFGTRTSRGWPDTTDLASVRQVHSDVIVVAEHTGCLAEGDALITNRPGITLSIRTADCLPILMADPIHRAVAAIHAGWRGVVLGIIPKTVQAMADRFGARPEDLIVAIGPGIGGCCFEVGPEVAVQFQEWFPERDDLASRTRVDLIETITRQLRRNNGTVGHLATAQHLDTAHLCTVCYAALFHSYRRDREQAGRMTATIRIRNAGPVE